MSTPDKAGKAMSSRLLTMKVSRDKDISPNNMLNLSEPVHAKSCGSFARLIAGDSSTAACEKAASRKWQQPGDTIERCGSYTRGTGGRRAQETTGA